MARRPGIGAAADILRGPMNGDATIHRHLAILRRGFLGIVGLALAGGVVAFIYSGLSPRVYESTATILVGPVLSTAEPDLNRLLAAQRLATTYAALAATRPFLEEVRAAVDLDAPVDSMADRLVAQAPAESTFITITFEDPDPGLAARVANAVAEALVAKAPEVADDATAGVPDAPAKLLAIVEPAIAPTAPSAPRLVFNVVMGVVVGLLLGIAAAYARAWARDDLSGRDDAESILNAPYLGELSGSTSAAQLSESVARLTQRIELVSGHPSRILITGPGVAPGLLGVAVARRSAGLSRPTLLVRLDLASRTPSGSGFEQLLAGSEVNASELASRGDAANLRLLGATAAFEAVAEETSSVRAAEAMDALSAIASSVVIVADRPADSVAALVLAAHATSIVIAVGSRARRHDLAESAEALRAVGGRIVGFALVGDGVPATIATQPLATTTLPAARSGRSGRS